MHTDGGNVFEIFLHLPVLKNSDFSDFTQKCNFSGNLSRNYFKFFKCMGDVIYIIILYQTGFIMWLSDPPPPANGNIDGGGGRILKEICLLLQFTSIFCTIDARITKLICMIPLCIQMMATYLKFFYVFQFWNNSDILWFYTKIQILCFKENTFNFLSGLEVH